MDAKAQRITALEADNRALQDAVLDLLARVQRLEAEAAERRFAALAASVYPEKRSAVQ